MVCDWTMQASVQLCVLPKLTASVAMMTRAQEGNSGGRFLCWDANPFLYTILVIKFSTISVSAVYKIHFERSKGLALETPNLRCEKGEKLRHAIPGHCPIWGHSKITKFQKVQGLEFKIFLLRNLSKAISYLCLSLDLSVICFSHKHRALPR